MVNYTLFTLHYMFQKLDYCLFEVPKCGFAEIELSIFMHFLFSCKFLMLGIVVSSWEFIGEIRLS